MRNSYPLTTLALFLYLAVFPSVVYFNPTFLQVGLTLLWPVVACEVLWRRGYRSLRLGWAEGLLLVVVGCYTAALFFNAQSVVFFDGVSRLLLPLELFLLFLFLRAALGDPEPAAAGRSRGQALADNIFFVIAGAAAVQALIGIYQICFQDFYRVGAHIGNANFFAAFIGVALCYLFPAVTQRSFQLLGKGGRRFLIILLILLVFLVLASRSRGGAAAVFACALVFLWFRMGLMKSVGFLFLMSVLLFTVPNPLRDRILTLHPSHDQFSRLFILEVKASSMLDHPFGLGPNMGKYHFASKAVELAPMEDLLFKKCRDPAHNLFVEAGLEGGIPAALALILLVCLLGLRWWRHRDQQMEDPLRFGAGLGLLMLVLHAQVEALDRSSFAGIIAVMLLAVFLQPSAPSADRPGSRLSIGRLGTLRPVRLFPVLAVTLLALTWPLSDQLRRAAGVFEDRSLPAERRDRFLDWAIRLCPWNYKAHQSRFQLARARVKNEGRMEDFHHARTAILQTLRLNPMAPEYYRMAGHFYTEVSPEMGALIDQRFAKIYSCFEKADELDPLYLQGRYHGLMRRYYPDHPDAYLVHSDAIDSLKVCFPKLKLYRGFCFERLGRIGEARSAYRQAEQQYNRSLKTVDGIPQGSLMRFFYEFNLSDFPIDYLRKRQQVLKGE